MQLDDHFLNMDEDDLRKEILRLREGIVTVRDRCATLSWNAESVGMRTFAAEMGINAAALTGLLRGGANEK